MLVGGAGGIEVHIDDSHCVVLVQRRTTTPDIEVRLTITDIEGLAQQMLWAKTLIEDMERERLGMPT